MNFLSRLLRAFRDFRAFLRAGPVVLRAHEEWTPEDRAELRAFLRSGTGRRYAQTVAATAVEAQVRVSAQAAAGQGGMPYWQGYADALRRVDYIHGQLSSPVPEQAHHSEFTTEAVGDDSATATA